MGNLNRAHRIFPVRDLKLRKWAIMGFCVVSFAGLISFLWTVDVSLITLFLYVIYILITLYVIRFAKVDLFSPLMFFVLFSFLGFGITLPIFSLFPDIAFFATNSSFYQCNFQYNSVAITYAFAVFLIGYVSFIIGFNVVKKGLKITVYERLTHPLLGLAVVSLVLIISSFYFRSQYHVGAPGYDAASIAHAGYISYPLMYGSLITTGLMFYSALIRKSAIYTVIGLLLFVLSALLAALLGWKGGSAWSILYILLIYYYVSKYKQNVGKKIHRQIIVFLFILVILFALFYQFVSYYRFLELATQEGVSLSAFYTNLQQFVNRQNVGSGEVILATLLRMLNRVSGLNNLIGITGYFQQGMAGNSTVPFFVSNLFGIGIQPEEFYTWNILGVNPNYITLAMPTSWGALYIYGGVVSVIIGMMAIGMFSKFLYLTFTSNTIRRDGRWIVFYAIFMVNIFWVVVFEGRMLYHFEKHFIALLAIYGFCIFLLNLLHPHLQFRKAVERST